MQEQAFLSDDPHEEALPPVNKFGLASALAGVCGLIAILAPAMGLVCVIAIVLGVIACFTGGAKSKAAMLGIGLGILALTWSIYGLRAKNEYMYQEGGKAAEHFLETLASGAKYKALELTEMEMDRQITGTNLQTYYDSLEREDAERVYDFMDNKQVQRVLEIGPDAQWEFSQGLSVTRDRNAAEVVVQCVNKANPEDLPINIHLQRTLNLLVGDESDTTAFWNVIEIKAPVSN
ncbi:MAG TPA: hypothetical protein DDW52_01255 [Planctomycetaceae bacterium]|nr:hypothetical protein [Planctomycetaceae bacterium]